MPADLPLLDTGLIVQTGGEGRTGVPRANFPGNWSGAFADLEESARQRASSRGRICSAMSYNLRPLILSTLLLLAPALVAQAPPRQGRGRGGPGQTVEKIRTLKPNLYMVTGGGANTLIRVTPDGLIVVDTKNPGDENFNRLMEEI